MPDTKKRDGAATNCSECQRRKQKCNRAWPCNRCHARKVPHLCHFGGFTTSQATKHVRQGVRRRSVQLDAPQEAAMHALLRQSNKTVAVIEQPSTDDSLETSNELQWDLRDILQRPLTDTLVQDFLFGGTNHYSYLVYAPQFTQDYVQWWQDRDAGDAVATELTCLILRVCACATQCLSTDKKETLAAQFRQSADDLSRRFHGLAQRLGTAVAPGTGGLVQVQQRMLGVLWLQSESQWTAAWHALGATIHEAQEQGMHLDPEDNVNDFERDMRRQAWCLLLTWDWKCSVLFGRPPIITHGTYTARQPMLRMYSTPGGIDSGPVPAMHLVLQYQLVVRVAKRFGHIALPLPIEAAVAVEAEVRAWLNSLPPAYHFNEAASTWLALQQAHLCSLAHVLILALLKPFVLGSAHGTAEDGARRRGVEAALAVLDVNHALHDALHADGLQPSMVFFAVFSTAAVLCAALANDSARTLPRRADVVASIGKALDMLHDMASSAKPFVQTGFETLHAVVEKLPLRANEAGLLDKTPPLYAPSTPISPQTLSPQTPTTPAFQSVFQGGGYPVAIPNPNPSPSPYHPYPCPYPSPVRPMSYVLGNGGGPGVGGALGLSYGSWDPPPLPASTTTPTPTPTTELYGWMGMGLGWPSGWEMG